MNIQNLFFSKKKKKKMKSILENRITNGRIWNNSLLETSNRTAQCLHVKNDLLFAGLTGTQDNSVFLVYDLEENTCIKETNYSAKVILY